MEEIKLNPDETYVIKQIEMKLNLTFHIRNQNVIFKNKDNKKDRCYCVIENGAVTKLYFINANFDRLPEELLKFPALQYLLLESNSLARLPEWFGELSNLTSFHMKNNPLHTLPTSFTHLNLLQDLSFSHTELETLPITFNQLANLKYLSFENNRLSELPPYCFQLPIIETITIQNEPITTLPNLFGGPTSLRKFYVERCPIQNLPPDLKYCHDLTHIAITHSKITEIGDYTFYNMKGLEVVNFAYNDLKIIPLSLADLPRLRELIFHHNQISLLPPTFGNFLSLEYLDMSHNIIPNLPPLLANCPSLKVAYISFNNLSLFPAWIINWTSIRDVYMEENDISTIVSPELLKNLSPRTPRKAHFNYLNLSTNNISDPKVFPLFNKMSFTSLNLYNNPAVDEFEDIYSEFGQDRDPTFYLRALFRFHTIIDDLVTSLKVNQIPKGSNHPENYYSYKDLGGDSEEILLNELARFSKLPIALEICQLFQNPASERLTKKILSLWPRFAVLDKLEMLK